MKEVVIGARTKGGVTRVQHGLVVHVVPHIRARGAKRVPIPAREQINTLRFSRSAEE